MVENDGGDASPTSLLMDQVFDLADATDHTLDNDNALVRKLLGTYFGEDAGSLDSSALVEEACGRVWGRVAGMGCRPTDGWTGTVIMSLFLLAGQDRREELPVQLWRVVAHPAEKMHDGLGRFIMRRAAAAVEEEQTSLSSPVLREFVVATLRRGGHPPPPVVVARQQRSSSSGQGIGVGEEEDGGGAPAPAPSQHGLRLALFVASHALETGLQADNGTSAAAAWETWRWNIHLDVVRLLRIGRLEYLSELVVTIAGPLYRGWGNAHALEDIWSLIAGSASERAELHLALLCILAEDLRPVLDVPKAFDLIYAGISSESSLSRRRGLHVLRLVLSWQEEEEASAPTPVAAAEEELEPPPPPPRCRSSGEGLFSREALLQWKDLARCLGVLCEETELHLLDQVVPTVRRLCSKLSPPPPADTAPADNGLDSGGGGGGGGAGADCPAGVAPLPTEFRWVAIPLGMLVRSGTFAHRRKLLHRIVRRELGLGEDADADAARGGGGGGDREGRRSAGGSLAHMEEAWVARVLLPALDQVGWNSSAARESLDELSVSVTSFLRLYLSALPAPRVTALLSLLLESFRERAIGSIGALCAVLAAFNLGPVGVGVGVGVGGGGGGGGDGARPKAVAAMGRDVLFQLKEMLLVVVPPLSPAKRVLFLDGIVRVLLDFTDYGALVLSPSSSRSPSCPPSLGLVTSILLAVPLELVRGRYLSQLAAWVAGFPLDPGEGEAVPVPVPPRVTLQRRRRQQQQHQQQRQRTQQEEEEQHKKRWLLLFTSRVERFLGRLRGRRWRRPSQPRVAGGEEEEGSFEGGAAEGRSLCLLGLVLSEGFVLWGDRDQVLANGLSPLVRLLRQCWNEPYVAAGSVRAALVLFGGWAAVAASEAERRGQGAAGREGRWRWRPLETVVSEVVTLVTARLVSLIDSGGSGGGGGGGGGEEDEGEDEGEDDDHTGRDAQVLLTALDAAAAYHPSSVLEGRQHRSSPPGGAAAGSGFGSGAGSAFHSHPGVVALGDRCASLLLPAPPRGGEDAPRLPPTSHLLAIASLEVVVRPRADADGGRQEQGPEQEEEHASSPCQETRRRLFPAAGWEGSQCKGLVLSLLRNKVEGRVTSGKGGSIEKGSSSDWGSILKRHELRKWSCLSALLPVVLGGGDPGSHEGASISEMCDALVEGILASSREEMPQALACFRAVFPVFVQSLPGGEQAAGFTGVFEAVFRAFKEVRRPQPSLVEDLVSAVLHPTLLGMPELNANVPGGTVGAARGTVTVDPREEDESSSSSSSSSCVVEAFSALLRFGVDNNKPGVLRAIVGRLTVHGRQSPGSMLALVPGMVELLLFRQWSRGQHGSEFLSNGTGSSSAAAEAPRFMLLLFVETSLIPAAANGNQGSRLVLRALALRLMDLLASQEFRQSSITDRAIYGRRLRAWQALCVLCGYLCAKPSPSEDSGHVTEVVEAVSAWFWPVHGRTALPPVRQLMEVFAVRMCTAYPDLFLAAVVKELKDFRLPGQVLCSLLIVAGHTLLGKEGGGGGGSGGGSSNLSAHHRVQMFEACLPWMVGTHVMGRLIAQLVCHSVLPECSADGVEGTHLGALFLFLRDNPDMVKMRQRQLEAFGRTDCAALCTVEGMLEAHGTGSTGDITPVHMCDLLKEAMDEIWNEGLLQDRTHTLKEGLAWLQTTAAVKSGVWFDEEEGGGGGGGVDSASKYSPEGGGGGGGDDALDGHIQQKIIPWDKLDLTVESASSASLEQSTAAGRTRQAVVMCASLVDKVPNLAGLARTSEIFAATKLVVPDARVLKNPAFSQISTGAEQWLPIEEVGEENLVAWLRRAKRQRQEGGGGHVLVGVEQTNNSVCLTKMTFHPHLRYTLVLGRENSGLPLEVIGEMDLCCQIPQQGVLRSLNAHVSGAIILAEYTRQMLHASPPKP